MGKERFLIGVCGGSGSGKSTFSKKLQEKFLNLRIKTSVVELDDFYLPKEIRKANFDDPKSLDWNLLLKVINLMKEGKELIEVPIYDKRVEDRIGFKKIEFGKVVILEGLWVLYKKELRDLLDLKIFIDVEDDIRLIRRLLRDKEKYGVDFTETLKRYLSFVREGYKKYVEPYKEYADIIIKNSYNEKILDMIVSYYLFKFGRK